LESLNSKYKDQLYIEVIEELRALPDDTLYQLQYTQLLIKCCEQLKAVSEAELFLAKHPLNDWKTQNVAAYFYFNTKNETSLSNTLKMLSKDNSVPSLVKLTQNENLAILQCDWLSALHFNEATFEHYKSGATPKRTILRGIEYGIRLLDTSILIERIRIAESEPNLEISLDEVLHAATITGEKSFFHIAAALIVLNGSQSLSESAVSILNVALANIPRPKLLQLKTVYPETVELNIIKANIKRRMGIVLTAQEFEALPPRNKVMRLIENSDWTSAHQVLVNERMESAEKHGLLNVLKELEGGKSIGPKLSNETVAVYESECLTNNVIICFSGINGTYFGLTDAALDQLLSQFTCHRIYIKDTERALHLNGFGHTSSFEEAGEYIKTILAKELNVATPCINVLTTSAGGLAGFQYAQIWKAQVVVAFSPPISVFSEFENRGKAVIRRLTQGFSKERLDFANFIKGQSIEIKAAHILYSANHSIDHKHAIEFDKVLVNVKLHSFDSAEHNVLRYLLDKNLAKNTISQLLKLE
jgi:hypothetical protein